VCQIASNIEKGAFFCFPAGDLFWDFAGAGADGATGAVFRDIA